MTQRHYVFGTGNLYALAAGSINPIPLGALQDLSVDFSGDIKQLYGQSSFALDVARGKVKIEGKAKAGLIDINLYNALFFGATLTTGETLAAFSEAGTVPASSVYTVTSANSATWKANLAVYYASTGVKFTQVASGPTIGQYSVAAGVYTFAAADASVPVLLNYTYTSASTGQTLTGANTLMGSVPTFQITMANQTKGKTQTLTLFTCVSSKLSLPFKQDDYEVAEIDFMAQDNGAGQVFTWSATGG